MNNITFGDETVGYYETVAGGSGAVSIFCFFLNDSICIGLYECYHIW